jgi:hypothetical protein
MYTQRWLARCPVLSGRNSVMISRGTHGSHFDVNPSNAMPFQTKKAGRLAFNMIWSLGLVFSLPFILVKFQLSKKAS